jgi:5'-3' exonuclease
VILFDTNQYLIARYTIWKQDRRNPFKVEDFKYRIRRSLERLLELLDRLCRYKEGDPVFLCIDSKSNWRTERFEHYKFNRSVTRLNDANDWNEIYECMDSAVSYMSAAYPPIRVENTEADDIIASICMANGVYTPDKAAPEILIISPDKDFLQLLKYWNVSIFNPTTNEFAKEAINPARALYEHILRGDRADGIPNYLSEDDCFVRGIRQKPVMAKKIESIVSQDPETVLEGEQLARYQRNRELIDMALIPLDIQKAVLDKFNNLQARGD